MVHGHYVWPYLQELAFAGKRSTCGDCDQWLHIQMTHMRLIGFVASNADPDVVCHRATMSPALCSLCVQWMELFLCLFTSFFCNWQIPFNVQWTVVEVGDWDEQLRYSPRPRLVGRYTVDGKSQEPKANTLWINVCHGVCEKLCVV